MAGLNQMWRHIIVSTVLIQEEILEEGGQKNKYIKHSDFVGTLEQIAILYRGVDTVRPTNVSNVKKQSKLM